MYNFPPPKGGVGGRPKRKPSFCSAKISDMDILRLEASLINEDDARPCQYTVWTAVCLRLRMMLGHVSTQSGLLSV